MVAEHFENVLGGVTYRRIARQSKFGPVEICLNSPKGDLREAEHAANARLIAAAPELLAALVAMVRKYAPSDDGYPGTTPAHQARAAISKAEGGS